MKYLPLAALAGIAMTVAPASAATFMGATTLTSPVYNRVLTGVPPSGLSAVGTAVHYQSVGFSVGTSGSYVFLMTAVQPALWDTFLTLYSGGFAPGSPLTNAIAANDDNPSIGLSGFTINLTAGVSYFAIATGFGNTDVGTYTLAINGPGTVTFAGAGAVPEPATWGLMMLGFSLAGAAIRRRVRASEVRFDARIRRIDEGAIA